MNKELELAALQNRYNVIFSRGKTSDGEGVLRKIKRKIRKVKAEMGQNE